MRCLIRPRTMLLLILTIARFQDADGQELPKHTYTYKTVGDLHILADVYRAPDHIIRPAILYIHGGALIMGDRSWLNPVQVKKYLDAGYAIISIDYRLSPQAKLNQIIESHRRGRAFSGGVLSPDRRFPTQSTARSGGVVLRLR
jgi:hypothetical protein